VAEAIQTRTKKLTDVVEMAGFFFRDEIKLQTDRIITDKMTARQAAEAAHLLADLFSGLEEIDSETAEEPLRNLAQELNLKAGQVFGLLREALTGQRVSPPLWDIMSILGKETVLERLEDAAVELERKAG